MKLTPSNLSTYKNSCKKKKKKLGLKLPYLGIFTLKLLEKATAILGNCRNTKFYAKIKILEFGTKNALCDMNNFGLRFCNSS